MTTLVPPTDRPYAIETVRAVAVLFLVRGALGYTARWRAMFTEEPFATLDRKNYSPLCLAIGIGFVILVVLRLL